MKEEIDALVLRVGYGNFELRNCKAVDGLFLENSAL